MRIPSGAIDRKIAFVAVDATDLKTRETGLTGFTVYRSRNGGAATAYTTPTVAELSAANMPGVYVLTIDEDTTLDAGHDSEEYLVHITHASIAPVTRALEMFRPKLTEGQTATAANGCVDADVERLAGDAPSLADLKDFADVGYDPVLNAVEGVKVLVTAAPLLATDILAIVNGVWDELTTELRTALSFGQLLKDNLNATVGSRASQSSLDLVDDFVDELETRLTATRAALLDNLANLDAAVTSRAAPGAAMALTVAERASVADKVLGRSIQAGADGGRTVAQALAFLRNKWAIDAGVLTVYDVDDVTPLFTANISRTALDAVTTFDP